MAPLPGMSDLQMSVEMLGLEANSSHVLGHLVKVNNPIGRVSLALPPGGCGTREKTSVTAQKHHPKCRLAINAGYFNVTDGACIGNLVSDGVVIQTVPLAQSNVNFGIRDGKFVIGYFTPEELQGFEQVVSGVTWLVRDGKSYVQQGWREANTTVQTSGDKYATNLASRTAVGVDKDGRLIILQIDGSIAVGHLKRGLNMFQLADLLIENGAVHAINLDGGGSSAMARDGVLINYPSDMRPPSCDASGKHQCERPVSTVLCVHELPEIVEQAVGQPSNQNAMLAGVAFLTFATGCISAFGLLVLFPNLMPGRKGMARQISGESAASSTAA
uniref:Phosphodiester glycosidase domain-containing protein n=1 Tax=Pyrodinium bahamense TaxID=73915 RepID=A0A7S0A6V4_9DINO|mmetsp:Transcript_23676/g.65496  ORF Transcript_23676/g.65496 Transcript_23676/m.65496 type:complete len:330 (+) Transcript_23676:2-991(+)